MCILGFGLVEIRNAFILTIILKFIYHGEYL